jgi:hypothetical protein
MRFFTHRGGRLLVWQTGPGYDNQHNQNGGTDQDQAAADEFYVSEYRKTLVSILEGVVGPLVKSQG